MLNLSLRQLRYFEALARHRHFGRAAAACAISQPALSEQIKELEATFGAALFERGARQVRATSLGEALSERVRGILSAIDELDGLAASHHPLRRLRLGVIPTVAPYLLPSVMAELARAHPDLDVHVRESITARLLEELAQGRIDAAIVALPAGGRAFEQATLFSEEFFLVRPSRRRTSSASAANDCCCWKRGIASAIKRWRSAASIRCARARRSKRVRSRPWFRWSAPAPESR
jgi:LysR family hydrogen peroxide-inducible transcriptional activator